MLQLHTVRNENLITPKHIWALPVSMNTTQIPPDTPQTSPIHPKTSPGSTKYQPMATGTNRACQTYSNSTCQCSRVSGGVWECSFGVCWRLLKFWVLWRCLGGVLGYLSGIHGNLRRWDVFGGYLGSPSLQYGAVTLFWHSPDRHDFFHLTIPRHKNIKMSIYKLDKNH